ncbi:AraC-like DNA-binding protein [Chitinophaga skermanii]|uniref:AraC-like DNA-binding protein n=1 Tax=Chitinophaga skermanii TaxID=331697 RepID=A0A327Q8Y4_9BACT|nr:helix-turn-helix domain-containing protein [Chitinophaga skermanii]RAJ00395.1 AraC-like DNA-binding protein [Chitinophaga skermanii]
MKDLFITFKPQAPLIAQYVDYYYLDVKPANNYLEYQCFPHFNSTISIYKSHLPKNNNVMTYDEAASPYQIYSPIRTKVLQVKQSGPLNRIVIVFHPFGVQQFFQNICYSAYLYDQSFFQLEEVNALFATTNKEVLVGLLDNYLLKRYQRVQQPIITAALAYIFDHYETFTVEGLAKHLSISRQHLNRLFQSHMGIAVKKLHEIVVFRKTINNKLFDNPGASFTSLAHAFNYNDQSHFNKTYKNLAANTPSSFFTKGTLLGEEDTFWHIKR